MSRRMLYYPEPPGRGRALLAALVATLASAAPFVSSAMGNDWTNIAALPFVGIAVAIYIGWARYIEVDTAKRLVSEWRGAWTARQQVATASFDHVDSVYVGRRRVSDSDGGRPSFESRVCVRLKSGEVLRTGTESDARADEIAEEIAKHTGATRLMNEADAE